MALAQDRHPPAKAAPRLWPLTLILCAIFWIIATTGGRHLLVKEALGEAFDSQAEHFLRGEVSVDVKAIRSEAMIEHGRVHMYFGPFLPVLRIPLNLIYPAGRGAWSRTSGFLAGVVILVAFAGLLRESLRLSPLSRRARAWLGNSCLIGMAFASPVLFLISNVSIYNEAIIWGFAFSLAALYFAYRSRTAEGKGLTRAMLGFSLCAAGALLARATFGAPLLLLAPLLAFRLPAEKRFKGLIALFLPIGLALALFLALSYARFGNFAGISLQHFKRSTREHAMFSAVRLPLGFADYFGLKPPRLENRAPFIVSRRRFFPKVSLYPISISETFITVPWSSSWLLLGAIAGIGLLFRRGGADKMDKWMAAAFFLEFVGILSYFSLAQRFSTDLYPFLVFSLLIFLRWGGPAFLRATLISLVVLSVCINFLATASWLGRDKNLPADTQIFWNSIFGRDLPPEIQKSQ